MTIHVELGCCLDNDSAIEHRYSLQVLWDNRLPVFVHAWLEGSETASSGIQYMPLKCAADQPFYEDACLIARSMLA
jgi:hypothetical protein